MPKPNPLADLPDDAFLAELRRRAAEAPADDDTDDDDPNEIVLRGSYAERFGAALGAFFADADADADDDDDDDDPPPLPHTKPKTGRGLFSR